MTPEQIKLDMAIMFNEIARHGWVDSIYTHASVLHEGIMYINEFGVEFDMITPDNIIAYDPSQPKPENVNIAGYVLHNALHTARPDINVIIHTHSIEGLAFCSVRGNKLYTTNQISCRFHNRLGYMDYRGLIQSTHNVADATEALTEKNLGVILYNHGVMVFGNTVPTAFNNLYLLERAMEIQNKALAATGGNVNMLCRLQEHIAESTATQFESLENYGEREWKSITRRHTK